MTLLCAILLRLDAIERADVRNLKRWEKNMSLRCVLLNRQGVRVLEILLKSNL